MVHSGVVLLRHDKYLSKMKHPIDAEERLIGDRSRIDRSPRFSNGIIFPAEAGVHDAELAVEPRFSGQCFHSVLQDGPGRIVVCQRHTVLPQLRVELAARRMVESRVEVQLGQAVKGNRGIAIHDS